MATKARNMVRATAAGRLIEPPVSVQRVRQLEAAGVLKATWVGGIRFFDPKDIASLNEVRRAQRAARKKGGEPSTGTG